MFPYFPSLCPASHSTDHNKSDLASVLSVDIETLPSIDSDSNGDDVWSLHGDENGTHSELILVSTFPHMKIVLVDFRWSD